MISILPFVFLAVASLAAAGFDLVGRRIPNWLNLGILLAGLGYLLTLPELTTALLHLAHFALALAASMLIFGLRMWGGGDAKFYSAVAVWFPLAQAPFLAMATALAGLAVLIAFFARTKLFGKADRMRELPYGVAIACGTLAIIALNEAILTAD